MRDNTELIELLDENYLTEKHLKYIDDNYLIEDLLYYINIFDYIDDKSFIEDWKQGEYDYYYSDFEYNFDKTEMIDIIECNISHEDIENLLEDSDCSIDELLEDLNNSELKEIIENYLDIEKIIYEFLDERFRGYSAHDILSEFYSESELQDIKVIDTHNLHSYIDEDSVFEDYKSNMYYEDIVDFYSNELDYDYDIQREIFEEDKSTVYELSSFKINCDYDFQEEFIKRHLYLVKTTLYDTNVLLESIYEKYEDTIGPVIYGEMLGLI